MELIDFIAVLEEALIKRGLSPDEAEKQIHRLQRTFRDEDLQEIKAIRSESEIETIAESIIQLRKKEKAQGNAAKTEPKAKDQEQSAPPAEKAADTPAPTPPTKKAPARTQRTPSHKKDPLSYEDEYTAKPGNNTSKGVYIFWLVLFFTLPITIALAAAFFGIFIGAFVALSALIAGLIVGLIGLVAVGAGVSLVGIIFGITQLFTFMAAGIYEIGLGIMVIGFVMLAGILIYNLAIRFLPWVIRKVAVLLRFTCGKIRDLFVFLKKECYKL